MEKEKKTKTRSQKNEILCMSMATSERVTTLNKYVNIAMVEKHEKNMYQNCLLDKVRLSVGTSMVASQKNGIRLKNYSISFFR